MVLKRTESARSATGQVGKILPLNVIEQKPCEPNASPARTALEEASGTCCVSGTRSPVTLGGLLVSLGFCTQSDEPPWLSSSGWKVCLEPSRWIDASCIVQEVEAEAGVVEK